MGKNIAPVQILEISGEKQFSDFIFELDCNHYRPRNNTVKKMNKKDWITLVTVSEWYDDLFHNWLLWYKILNMDMELVVIAEDNSTNIRYSNRSDMTLLHFDMKEVHIGGQKIFIIVKTLPSPWERAM